MKIHVNVLLCSLLAVLFSTYNACASLSEDPKVLLNNEKINSISAVLNAKDAESNVYYTRGEYKNVLLPHSKPLCMRILLDYSALFIDDEEEEFLFLNTVVQSLGSDLRHLLETGRYNLILENKIAKHLIIQSGIVGGGNRKFIKYVQDNRDKLKDIIKIVEKEAFDSDP